MEYNHEKHEDALRTSHESCGVMYAGYGKEYIELATKSARSVKRHAPKLPVAIATDVHRVDDVWDHVIHEPLTPIPPKAEKKSQAPVLPNDYIWAKLRSMLKSPFKRTLYLDGDTYVLDDITDVFRLLDRVEMGFTFGHDRVERHYKSRKWQAIPDIVPYAFAPLQGGFVLFKDTPGVKIVINTVANEYPWQGHHDEQMTWRRALWLHPHLRFYMLPPEWNFNSMRDIVMWGERHFREARPKIMHYTLMGKKWDGHQIENWRSRFTETEGVAY
jgi:hypothetical protein